MTKPMLLADFARLPPVTRALMFEGLSGAIDLVADAAPGTHRFLRYQWFAAALATGGGQARTILIEHDGDAVIALPMIGFGPAAARLATLPGCDRPFRSFPASMAAEEGAYTTLIERLGREVNALRIGPSGDGDPSLARLLDAARASGWAVLDRSVARTSAGAILAGDGANFTGIGHGPFWSIAAQDPLLVQAMRAALPMIEDASTAVRRDWLLVRPGLPAMLGHALRHLWARGGQRAMLPGI